MMLNNQVYKKTKVLTMLNFIQIQLYRKLKIADKPALDNSSYTGGGGVIGHCKKEMQKYCSLGLIIIACLHINKC